MGIEPTTLMFSAPCSTKLCALANLQLAFVLCLGKLGKYLVQYKHSCSIFIHPYYTLAEGDNRLEMPGLG